MSRVRGCRASVCCGVDSAFGPCTAADFHPGADVYAGPANGLDADRAADREHGDLR